MTSNEALKKYQNVEIELLLADVLKKPREFLFMHPEFILTSKHLNILSKYIKRRKQGEPIAYILGYKDFMGLRFKVNKDVLIPRPETEWLVEKIVQSEKLKVKSGRIRILDLGTGSGCIIISLAKLLSTKHLALSTSFYASDISKKALAIAKANAKENGVKIQFIHSDILQNIRISFDVIVANLPYVSRKDYRLLIKDLRYEPKGALVDPVRDFDIYKRFFEQVPAHLNPGGVILLEIDPKSKPVLSKYAKRYLPASRFAFYRDLNKLWRYMEIKT